MYATIQSSKPIRLGGTLRSSKDYVAGNQQPTFPDNAIGATIVEVAGHRNPSPKTLLNKAREHFFLEETGNRMMPVKLLENGLERNAEIPTCMQGNIKGEQENLIIRWHNDVIRWAIYKTARIQLNQEHVFSTDIESGVLVVRERNRRFPKMNKLLAKLYVNGPRDLAARIYVDKDELELVSQMFKRKGLNYKTVNTSTERLYFTL